jgi:NADH-quinone oxidoreductase subunit I
MIQYPDRKPVPTVPRNAGFSEERCIVCHNCAKACPIDIIHIADHFEEVEIDGKKKKKKVLDRYDIDVKRCMFCGLCEEACPTEPLAIWLTTKSYETAAYERNEQLYFDKKRLQSWEGVKPYPGVVHPDAGQMPGNHRASSVGPEASDELVHRPLRPDRLHFLPPARWPGPSA